MYMYIHVTVISAFHTGNYELGWHIIVMIVCIHVQCICVMCLLPDTILHVHVHCSFNSQINLTCSVAVNRI